MSDAVHAAPTRRKFLTRGVYILLALMACGTFFAARRFIYGIGAITNLNDQYPWGIWIAVDVACGVALAAGGFTTAALAHIFHREKFHPLVRPALLTAALGYTFVALGLLVDLGRFYNIWHPMLPMMWSGNSGLFEVGMCVMTYLTVLYIEMMPIVVERFMGRVNLPGALALLNGTIEFLLRLFDRTLGRVMSLFIIAGVVLSCMHQSSLGVLLVLTPFKMHPLWMTPIQPLLFLLSAFAVGLSMAIFEGYFAARSFSLEQETPVFRGLTRIIPVLLMILLTVKVTDLAIRGVFVHLGDGGIEPRFFLAEVLLGVVTPLILFLLDWTRRSPGRMAFAAALVIGGVVLNRINVFLVAYKPVYMQNRYVPAIGELAVTAGLIACLIFIYRFLVIHLPILPAAHSAAPANQGTEVRHV